MPQLSYGQLRWWFFSRRSGDLNSLSFWLLALAASLPLYALLSLTFTDYFEIERDSQLSNWIRSQPGVPRVLVVAADMGGPASS